MLQHFWKSFCLQDGVSLGHGGNPGVDKCGCPALSCCTYLAGDARLNPAIECLAQKQIYPWKFGNRQEEALRQDLDRGCLRQPPKSYQVTSKNKISP